MPNRYPNRLEELDSLRGIAALIVVVFHYTMHQTGPGHPLQLGSTGVDLFFIISGFVIFMSLSNVKTAKEFIINRVSRLYPTYWTCVTCTFLLNRACTTGSEQYPRATVLEYAANMTMFQHFFRVRDLDDPYWTMIVEMLFYIGMVILFKKNLLRYIVPIGFMLLPVTLMLHALKEYYVVDKLLDGLIIIRYIPLFFAGILFYKIKGNEKPVWRLYGIVLCCLIAQVLLFKHINREWIMNQMQYALTLVLYFTLFVLFVQNRLKFIVTKPTLFIGKVSFSLYLIHQFVSLEIVIPFLTKQLQINYWIASFGICLPLMIGVAWLITHYIETPMNRWMKHKLSMTLLHRRMTTFTQRLG